MKCCDCGKFFEEDDSSSECRACGGMCCSYCQIFMQPIPKVCDGKCYEGYEVDENSFKTTRTNVCTCLPRIVELRDYFYCNTVWFCRKCLTDDAPYGITDRELIRFLIRDRYKSIGEARLDCLKDQQEELEEDQQEELEEE